MQQLVKEQPFVGSFLTYTGPGQRLTIHFSSGVLINVRIFCGPLEQGWPEHRAISVKPSIYYYHEVMPLLTCIAHLIGGSI